MNIFILEDDFIQQSYLEAVIKKLVAKHHWACQTFQVFAKPSHLLESIKERGSHQVFFLDIEIKAEQQKGLAVANQIRELDPQAVIVFVTTHSEFMPLTFQYQVSALDFIDKGLDANLFEQRIERVLTYVLGQAGRVVSQASFHFKSKHSQIEVPLEKVLYLETSTVAHKVILYTENQRLEFYGNLSDVVKQNPSLYNCHRSFVVNPANVSFIDKKQNIVYLKNQSSCFVARLKMRKLLELVSKLDKR
ncbi:response regulator transcription factor [Streptococcus oricebi]|uniref:DNA-binding response regulator n=1 Tax=Streptococcus oricebi TaxID=1547447 RepID=A0ABS5B2Z2_9STRE|nr:response regulator transcription factor [Streptococcus oricebi]MBP2623190.1 DNA-binding response regulator [Streptococcus oricebi]